MATRELELRVIHAQDQAHAHIAEHMGDLERLAGDGFDGSERDRLLVSNMAHVLIGDICLRRHFSRAEQTE